MKPYLAKWTALRSWVESLCNLKFVDTQKFGQPGSQLNSVVGPAIASAATIAPTSLIHHVTGTAAIVNITPPTPDFQGDIILIADGIWTWTAAGNIGVLGTTTAAGRAIRFTYDGSKWYPSVVA